MGQRIDVNHENIYYGDFLAVEDEHQHRAEQGHLLHRPVRLRQVHRAAHLGPYARDHPPALTSRGEVLLEGKNLYDKDVDPVAVRRDVGMVFQRPNLRSDHVHP